jgi:hypothetical protein
MNCLHSYIKLKKRLCTYYTLTRSLLGYRRVWKAEPVNHFTTEGYEIIENFFPVPECDRLIALADRLSTDHGYKIKGNCYFIKLSDVGDKIDEHQSRLMNVQDIDQNIADLYTSGRVEGLLYDRMHQKLVLRSCTIQIDDIDTKTKRGFHVDDYFPPHYKAFIYLNDVENLSDGPYTVIPGSHKDTWKKVVNLAYNECKGFDKTDIRLFYKDKDAIGITAPRGTCIISNQSIVHKGWQIHSGRKRYVLILYLSLKQYSDNSPFTLGKSLIPENRNALVKL